MNWSKRKTPVKRKAFLFKVTELYDDIKTVCLPRPEFAPSVESC